MQYPVASSKGEFVAGAPSSPSARTPGPPKPRQTPDQLRVMVAGESGLGKDTPGYGDHVNISSSFQPVIDHIIKGNKMFLAEVQSGNDAPPDGRTDVCIYFIAAHRCKPIDIEYMKQLSKVVAVIPVIGKADSMTVDEMRDFKAEITEQATQASEASELEFFNFSGETWSACLEILRTPANPTWLGEKQPPPYAVISSRLDDSDESIAGPNPARRYPWGTCHVMETAHSDNRYLQCLLLEVGFQDVKNEMKRRHKAFRVEQAQPIGSRLRRRASNLALNTLKVADTIERRRKLPVVAVVFSLLVIFLGLLLQWSQGGVKAPEGPADWSNIIRKIQQLEGAERILKADDYGNDSLFTLKHVLEMHYRQL